MSPAANGQGLDSHHELTNDVLRTVYDDINGRVQASLTTIADGAVLPAGICYEGNAALQDGERSFQTRWVTARPTWTGMADSGRPKSGATSHHRGRPLTDVGPANRGAIAVKVYCSASGAGGARSYIVLYDNSLSLLERKDDFSALHTALRLCAPVPEGDLVLWRKLRRR